MSAPQRMSRSADAENDAPLSVEDAYEHVWGSALADSAVGTVGLELEAHVVDLGVVAEPVGWDRVEPLPANARTAAGRSSVTREPGGQLELSGPPQPTLLAAVTALRLDVRSVRLALAEHGVGLAHAGTDPLRPSRRMNPHPRYRAMEEHFTATGRTTPGAVTMNSTASIQVNLNAGHEREWPKRVARAHRLGPTLLAISANSPWLHGRATGWKSTRQRAWLGLDQRHCGPVPGTFAGPGGHGLASDPAAAWARFALCAPILFVKTGDQDVAAVRTSVTFEQWASGQVPLNGRLPTAGDLDLHLTTLFPPVRMRGYLELRYLDATPPRWWPAIAAVATTLMDDPVAADLAAEATERTGLLWREAARDGLADARLADSARRCVRIAADRVPAELSSAVADLAELVESGRCPGDLLTQRIAQVGPRAALAEFAHP
ncbi:MAG: ergothioneine biosynthesis glutamate--cysteine ligase EgtA [Actinoallomurus sp.]